MLNSCYSITILFPRALVSFLYCWTAYVTITRVNQFPLAFIRIAIISVLFLGLYTYFKLVYTGPGSPLDFSELEIHDLLAAENGTELPPDFLSKRSITSKRDGRFRVCRTCHVWKPDRCHHCSTCNRCVLKMDHHCPWLPGCIGFKNQKYFIQFLLYSTFYASIILTITSLQLYMWFHDGVFERELIDLLLLSVWLLAVGVTTALFCFTTFSILQATKNQTTIEMYGLRRYREDLAVLGNTVTLQNAQSDNIFDLGSPLANWCDVMGSTFLEWCLPIETFKSTKNKNSFFEKGLFFEFRADMNERILETLSLQDRLLRRLTPRSSMDV